MTCAVFLADRKKVLDRTIEINQFGRSFCIPSSRNVTKYHYVFGAPLSHRKAQKGV